MTVDRTIARNEYVLPVAYDGEFFLPLGRGETKNGTTEITLERLSEPLSEGERSLGGSIRIFFQKIITEKLPKVLVERIGIKNPYPILAAVKVDEDGTPHYEAKPEVVRQKVAEANKIVLYIHGIIGDTQSMVPSVREPILDDNGQLKSLNEIYDLVLAFDYENLNTPIEEIAEKLKERLEGVELKPNHGKVLHIIAHSMGGLVSRSFIEQQKRGKEIVQHLIMLGTPNEGSPWSTVQEWATIALTIGINSLSKVALPVKILGILVRAIEIIDITLDQMKPNSEFLNSLQNTADPQIPYTIIAGNTSIIEPGDQETNNRLKSLLEKLGRAAIEFPFLGQPNDIAVTVESIFLN